MIFLSKSTISLKVKSLKKNNNNIFQSDSYIPDEEILIRSKYANNPFPVEAHKVT